MKHEVLLGGQIYNSRLPPPRTLGSPTSKIPALALPALSCAHVALILALAFRKDFLPSPFRHIFPLPLFFLPHPFPFPQKLVFAFPDLPHQIS